MKYLYSLLLLVCMVSCKQESTKTLMSSETNTQAIKRSALIDTFKYQPDVLPIISAHRGGKNIKNYPENCLETLQYVNDSIPAIYEIDVAKTKDHQLVLLHDNSLERTTTGAGRLTAFTYQQLKNYNLKDAYGNVTSFKIPLFSDVLKWAIANDAVLTVDIKRSVEVQVVIAAIRQEQAEDHCIIITYDMEQAKKAYALAPNYYCLFPQEMTRSWSG
ncbi:glycerophosphodiester phosphodiesterase family protein [Lacinutrix neustonica]|uniref:Glycerophosphodiester phosphodiesterase family protein n=1 Tax=Lacinutrix neustonica TaxID=2980107 RepID=A0A9E8MX38_9FLAO|nr:glycerophosphodiester phosphodiesterase family protein [Lacinutrix neustonica]WAC03158.1 glycerophosphodiester phosphodiesterase family protein [Lacinutrix neustonica]